MGKKITTYLIDDNQYGPKTVEIGNWSGKAIYAPATYISKLVNERKEFNKPGIYFLKSSSDKPIYSEKIYIGECEVVKERFKKHLQDPNKEFNECVVFISKDDMLNKAHVKYLESRAISIVKEANTAELENTNHSNIPALHEADISDMEYFLDQIKIILPLLGYMCFKSNTIDIEESEELVQSIQNNKERVYYIERGNIKAQLVITEKAIIVLKGSTCRTEHNNSLKKGRINLKKRLIEGNILVEGEEGVYVFNKDTIFNSPSEAASVILGAQTSGPQTWKDKNGKTYLENMKSEIR